MKKLLSKAKGLTIVILFLLLSCKTIKEENTEMFKDFLRQEKINYKDIIYSSYYKDFFCKIAHKTHYKDSTFLKYNRIYIQEEPYLMLSLYIFHPLGKVFRSYIKLDNEKLSKPNDEGIFYTKTGPAHNTCAGLNQFKDHERHNTIRHPPGIPGARHQRRCGNTRPHRPGHHAGDRAPPRPPNPAQTQTQTSTRIQRPYRRGSMRTHKLKIQEIPLKDIALLAGNPRRGNIDAVAESMETNGVYQPVIINRGTHTGREMEVIAGNHRVQAAQKLGLETIPAIVLDITDSEAKRIALADNRTSDLAEYDAQALLDMLDELDDLVGTGYDLDDLDELRADLEEIAEEIEPEKDTEGGSLEEQFGTPPLHHPIGARRGMAGP